MQVASIYMGEYKTVEAFTFFYKGDVAFATHKKIKCLIIQKV